MTYGNLSKAWLGMRVISLRDHSPTLDCHSLESVIGIGKRGNDTCPRRKTGSWFHYGECFMKDLASSDVNMDEVGILDLECRDNRRD